MKFRVASKKEKRKMKNYYDDLIFKYAIARRKTEKKIGNTISSR